MRYSYILHKINFPNKIKNLPYSHIQNHKKPTDKSVGHEKLFLTAISIFFDTVSHACGC